MVKSAKHIASELVRYDHSKGHTCVLVAKSSCVTMLKEFFTQLGQTNWLQVLLRSIKVKASIQFKQSDVVCLVFITKLFMQYYLIINVSVIFLKLITQITTLP